MSNAERMKKILEKGLDDEMKAKIRGHLAARTPILCGTKSQLYTDGLGGA